VAGLIITDMTLGEASQASGAVVIWFMAKRTDAQRVENYIMCARRKLVSDGDMMMTGYA
jgi:hypothetical protein